MSQGLRLLGSSSADVQVPQRGGQIFAVWLPPLAWPETAKRPAISCEPKTHSAALVGRQTNRVFPLQRFETLYEGTVLLSPAIQQPLMRFAALQSFMNRKLATYSVSCSHHDFLVSKKPSWFLRFCRPLLHLQSIGSSSPALFVLFRVRFRSEPVVHADMFNAVLEVSFSIATSI